MKDRILLGLAYVLLVGVVVWMSWDLDRRAQQTQEVVCVAAFANASVLLNIVVGTGVVVPEETKAQVAVVLDVLASACEPVLDRIPDVAVVDPDVA